MLFFIHSKMVFFSYLYIIILLINFQKKYFSIFFCITKSSFKQKFAFIKKYFSKIDNLMSLILQAKVQAISYISFLKIKYIKSTFFNILK